LGVSATILKFIGSLDIFKVSQGVLVRPAGLDMGEVGGSNPPGPTKLLSRCF